MKSKSNIYSKLAVADQVFRPREDSGKLGSESSILITHGMSLRLRQAIAGRPSVRSRQSYAVLTHNGKGFIVSGFLDLTRGLCSFTKTIEWLEASDLIRDLRHTHPCPMSSSSIPTSSSMTPWTSGPPSHLEQRDHRLKV